jgi:hypothetical protein
MTESDVEAKLHAFTNSLVKEIVTLALETIWEISFEIASTEDGR